MQTARQTAFASNYHAQIRALKGKYRCKRDLTDKMHLTPETAAVDTPLFLPMQAIPQLFRAARILVRIVARMKLSATAMIGGIAMAAAPPSPAAMPTESALFCSQAGMIMA